MSRMGKETLAYRKISDVPAYVRELSERGAKVIIAEKYARIAARKGQPGEQVISWSVDANGNPILEKDALVTVDVQTGEADWVVTKVTEDGQAIIDSNGNKNEWVIDDTTFHKKYEEDPTRIGIYKPVGGPQRFLKLSEAVTIQQWGSEMNVDSDGYINVTDMNDIYVVSGRDFGDTYKIVM